jgi:hypothetical protein
VETFGDQLLAGAAFADNEHGAVHRRCGTGAFDRIEKGGRLADELVVTFHFQELANFTIYWQVFQIEKVDSVSTMSSFGQKPPFRKTGTPYA